MALSKHTTLRPSALHVGESCTHLQKLHMVYLQHSLAWPKKKEAAKSLQSSPSHYYDDDIFVETQPLLAKKQTSNHLFMQYLIWNHVSYLLGVAVLYLFARLLFWLSFHDIVIIIIIIGEYLAAECCSWGVHVKMNTIISSALSSTILSTMQLFVESGNAYHHASRTSLKQIQEKHYFSMALLKGHSCVPLQQQLCTKHSQSQR